MTTTPTEKTKRFQTIFFDMDGTLIESGPGVMNAVRYMFGKVGYEENDVSRIRAFLGPPIIHRLMGTYGFDETAAQAAYAYYREYYDSRGMYESRLYPGIDDVLTALSRAGKTLYVATSKPEHQAIDMLTRTGVISRFKRVFGAVHDEEVYTKDEVLIRATTLLGKTPPSSVMIGDRKHDVIGARHVGMDTVGVLYGYGDLNELKAAGCNMIAEYPSDLLTLLMEDNG